jgi:hypothetical protein
MTSVRLASAIVVFLTFALALGIAARHDRHRRASSPLPSTDWRAALGNALVEAVVMASALGLAAVAIAMR